MSNEIVYSNKNELSFSSTFNFIQILIKRKFLFLSIVLLTILTCFIYLNYFKVASKVTLKFYPVSDNYILQYKKINNFQIRDLNSDILFTQTTKDRLFFNFQRHFKGSIFLDKIKDRYNLNNMSISEDEKNILANQIAEGYKLRLSDNIDNSNPSLKFLELEFFSNNIEKDREFLSELIPSIEDSLRLDYEDEIKISTTIIEGLYENKLNELKQQISIENYKEEVRTQSYVNYLEKHAQIARKINLDIPDLQSIEVLNLEIPNQPFENYASSELSQNEFVDNDKGDFYSFPLYFRGYIALEKEIELLKDSSPRVFKSEIAQIEAQIELLRQKSDLKRYKALVLETPYLNNDFRSINYDLGTLLIEPKSKTNLLLLIFITGFILSLIFPYVVEEYLNFKKNSNNNNDNNT